MPTDWINSDYRAWNRCLKWLNKGQQVTCMIMSGDAKDQDHSATKSGDNDFGHHIWFNLEGIFNYDKIILFFRAASTKTLAVVKIHVLVKMLCQERLTMLLCSNTK